MIYAIEAVGSGFVKFGVTSLAESDSRLKNMQTGCPYDLIVRATAMWPDREELRIHRHLVEVRHRGEWFRISQQTEQVIAIMEDGDIELWFKVLAASAPSRLRKVVSIALPHRTIPEIP